VSTQVTIGRGPGSSITDTGTLVSGKLRVCVFNKVSQHLWLRRIGARRGVFGGGSVDYYYTAYKGTSAHEPDTRYCRTNLQTTNVAMDNAGNGADIDHAVTVVDQGPSNKAAQVYAGSYVAIGIEQTSSGTLMHGMVGAASISADEERFFERTGLGGAPPDPFGTYSSATNQGHMSVWAICDTNDAPATPVNRTADASSGDLTPTMQADFRDNNGTWGAANGFFDDGDVLNKVQIQLRRQSDNVIFWDVTYEATGSEQSADQSSRQYTGTTLTRGTAYEWRIRHQDQFGAWSDFSTWLAYTPPATGTVTISAGQTPAGKQETVNPTPFQFTWSHNGAQSTNAVQVRIKRSGTITQTSGTITKTVANGAVGSITWAESGFSDLLWGSSFTDEIRGRDTSNQWSDWSAGHAFTTDRAPTVPASLSPSNGLTLTALPKLAASWSDVDDTTGTGLTGTFEITRPDATVVSVTPTYNSSLDRWEFQTTATQVTIAGTYSWRARSFDGTLYSGGVTAAGSATWSATANFTYSTTGSTLVITTPSDQATIFTATPTLVWTASTQAQYRVQAFNQGKATPIYDSGFIVDATTRSAAIPAGLLRVSRTYDFQVSVKDAGALQTDAKITNIWLNYIAPADVTGLQAYAVAVKTDPWPTAIRLEWEESTISDDVFRGYYVYRDDIEDYPIAFISSKSHTTMLDLIPASGRGNTYYHFTAALDQSTNELMSVGVTATASVTLLGAVVVGVVHPTKVRAIGTSVQERGHARVGIETTYLPWGAITAQPNTALAAPTTIKGKARYWEVTMTLLIIGDAQMDAEGRRLEWEALDASGETACYRDETGRKLFATIPAEGGLNVSDMKFGRATVDLVLRQESFLEGILSKGD
jgi:hypothetical protein